MKIRSLFIALIFNWIFSFAQQDAQYTQYMYNTMNVNPAYAGSYRSINIFGLHRSQWIGLDGAPKTNVFSINFPIENSNIGLGLSFVNDKIGPTIENTISADISYTIQTSEMFKLAFGIKTTANFFDFNINNLNPQHNDDPLFKNINNKFTTNLGAGIYFYSDKLYFGISTPNFFESNRYSDNDITIYKERLNNYIIGGYVFDLSSNLKFKPAFLTKFVSGSPIQLDISANFLINEKFTIGSAWRWNAAISALTGFQITKELFMGYSYDLETTKLKNYNSGSHELFIKFELFNRNSKIISPRFF